MENPLNIVSELPGTSSVNILQVATLDSRYDHIREDYTTPGHGVPLMQDNDFETRGFQEIE